jgi:shikimate kinase
MGTGKSRVARILADGLEWQLADTDRIMEKETGMRIAEFWKTAGAEAFQKKELEVLRRVRYYHEAVIAVGGNYPMTEQKFNLLRQYGFVVLMYAHSFRLAERVKKRIGKRPTMDYDDVDGFVRKMRHKWVKWIPRVDMAVNTTHRHPTRTALLIARYIDRHHIKFARRAERSPVHEKNRSTDKRRRFPRNERSYSKRSSRRI